MSSEENQELHQQATTTTTATEETIPSSVNDIPSSLNVAACDEGREKEEEDQISDKDNNNEKTQPILEEENTEKDTSTVGETSPLDHEDENSENNFVDENLTNKTDDHQHDHLGSVQQNGIVKEEEDKKEEKIVKPDLTPNPEDLLTFENGFIEKYKKISDVYKERLARHSNMQELLDLIDCEIKMLDFIRDQYATEFDEYNITNFKSANAIWFLQTHMVSILNHTTSLHMIEDNDLLSKIGDLINAAIRDYIYIKITYPFDLFQKIMESQAEQKSEKTEKSSESLELEESKSSSQLSEKEKQSQIVQKINLISKSLVLGVDVCRSLTFQKHEIYSKNLVFARDNKMATNEYNHYMELIQKHPQSTWNEDFANCIVSTPKPKGENILSKLCCKSINIFAQNGGYYLFNELLKKYKDLPIRVIEKIIDTISYQLAFLDQKTKETFVPEIINSMFIYIDSLSDEMLKIEEKFKDLLSVFRTKIISLYYNDEKSLEFYDRLKLQYFYRLLHCHSVERKMLGMNEIRSHVDTLIKADQMSKQGGSSPQLNGSNDSNMSSVNISKKDLHIRIFIAWSSEKKLLGYLFETDVHRELVRQSLSILKLLAQHKGFSREELDLLWNASVDKHEATERLILSTLAGFVPLLSLNDILYLYSKIEAIPVETISKRDHMVDFLSHFTICAVNSFSKLKEKKKNWFALDLLWKLAIGGNRKAFECLSELFKQDCFESIRKTYLLNCIDMLKSRHNTSGTVSLMKTLLATYSLQKRKKKQSTWGVIASINEKTNLMDHFFTNFEIQFPSDMENTSQTDQELRDQLDFLEFVIRNSPITLSVKNCIVLWTHGNRDIVMEWMAKMRENYCEDFTSFDDETTRFVFEELVCSLIGENENIIIIEQPNSGKKFISKIITKGKELLEPPVPSQEMEEDPVPVVKKIKKIDVLSDDLIGLVHFWNLILSVKDQKVLRQAIECLNNYKTGYAKELKHFIADYREKFIAKCMELLKQYSSPSKRKDAYICNIISLMIDYIVVANQKSGGGGYKGHGISFLGYPITLKISCYTNESFVKSVSSKMKIYELTNIIASELGDESSAHLLRLETEKGEDLSCYKHKTLEDLGLESSAEIYVRPISSRDITFSLTSNALKALGVPELGNVFLSRNRSSAKKSKKQEGGFLASSTHNDDGLDEEYVILNLEDGLNPASILSKESHFSLLFSLLDGSSSDEVAKKVWMLLMHLPTNYAMSKNILNIENMQGNINWMEILPTNSTHKLLYCLQILDSKFSKNFVPGSKMYDNFVKYGGLKHLVDGLLCIGKSYKNPLQKQCAALLLKILNKFIPENNERLNEILLNLLETLRVLIVEETEKRVNNSNLSDSSTTHRPTTSFQYNPQFTTTSEYAHFMLYDFALTTILKITSSKPDLLQLLLTHETTLSTTKSLLFSPDANIRKKFANTILELSSSSSQASSYFITTLYNIMMTEDIDLYKDRCDDYFLLLENSIMNSKHFTEISQEEVFTIVKKIFDRPIIEENNTSAADQVLIGYFNIAKALIRTYPFLKQELHKHIKDLFLNGLFEVPKLTDQTDNLPLPKCKTKESRSATFNFLQEVVDGCPDNYLEILQLLEEYIRGCEQPQNWQVYPIYQEKKKPFVGLKNQGATCYMNSLLQQFFMTIPFRKELITVNTDELPTNEKLQENVSLLREVQDMFAFLEYGRKKFYDTRPFCRVYKVDGRPVECSTQHDANEFFNLFMDCVEEALKFYKKDYLLRDVYGGSLLHQIIYEENISERPENFNIISLEVKNKRNIMESLELYCQGEMLEGNNQYFSDKLDRHVDALKRTLIKDLPNVLILHLKRFDFDFSLMVNRKINDRVEFPHLLNMEPYTVEGMERKENRGIYDIPPPHRPDDYYQYKLVGVLVHSGSADSGHYYSFIMDRKNEEEKWYEFNDEEINPFDLNRMEMECFGGLVEHNISGKKTSLFRCNNAYMLFYQRVSVLNAESFETKETSAIQPASSVMTQVWKENEKFYHYKNIFDESFDSYLFGNLSTYQSNDYAMVLRNVQLSCNYIFGYYIRSYNPKIVKWITYLKDTFEKHSRIAKWFLVEFARTDKWKIDSLLICPSQEIRDSVVDLIIATLRSLYPVENLFEYFEKEEWRFTTTKTMNNYPNFDEPMEVTEKDYECSSGFFIDCMIDMLSIVPQFHKSTAHYFRLLEDIVSLGPISYRLLCVKRQLVSKLALILGGLLPKHQNEGEPIYFNFNPKYSIVTTFGQLSVAFIIRIFSILVRTCSASTTARPPTIMDTDQEDSITGVIVSSGPLINPNPRTEPYAYSLCSSDKDKLFHRLFFNHLVNMNIRLQDISAMLCHWCWDSISISKKFCELFIQSIIVNSATESSDSYFLVFDSLLTIEDSLQSERVGFCLDQYFDSLSRMTDNNSLLYCMKHLAKIDRMNAYTKSWWDNNFKSIETITSKKGWTIERKQ
ncbi:predicted protein [Naegleria gruberi]|uniref:Predicted protein n=1 Tax=Naegleria gruberi TaxID=5762 RepID=D2VWJ1_NAEGR|nr:uncharacterized protein NAEGRDRAFT_73398 [Naegleria gruberi]EFC38903.1 predicted protein [Naegleria gruberi]|eukprot:XP_002671647.1 predicted protein [Naegleria gruberi strain NEG-M]